MEEPKSPPESPFEKPSDMDPDTPSELLPDAPPPEPTEPDVLPEILPEELQPAEPVQALPPAAPPPAPPAPTYAEDRMNPQSERNWAMLAHLSILLNLVTGFLGPIVALIIYLAYKDRSKYVAYQAMQSLVFQLVFFFGAGLLAIIFGTITLVLMAVVVGCCLLPIAFVLTLVPVAAVIYGVYAAIPTSRGEDFRYWLVGDWVMPKEGSPGSV